MKEEQKGETLEQFREQVSSLEAVVTSLKHQLAGSKGRNKQLKFMNEELQRDVVQKTDLLSVANESITAYRTQLHETNATLESYKCIVEWYNKLPWWRKMFVWRLF